jgi:hypothetical protein
VLVVMPLVVLLSQGSGCCGCCCVLMVLDGLRCGREARCRAPADGGAATLARRRAGSAPAAAARHTAAWQHLALHGGVLGADQTIVWGVFKSNM